MGLLKMELNIGVRPILRMSLAGRENVVDFDLTKAINKGELSTADNSFNMFLGYLEYVKKEEEYFNIIEDLFEAVVDLANPNELSDALLPILDIMDDNLLEKYLTKIGYTSPAFLADVFNNNIIINKEGTREQTYTKTDYRDLVKLGLKVKSIIPIILRYIYIHEVSVNNSSSMRAYRIFNNLKPISTMPAYVKMLAYVDKNIGGDDAISEQDIARILTKGITRIKFSGFISLAILIYLGVVATPDNDINQHNIVNHMFRLCKNKTSPNTSIMVNDPSISTDEDDSNSSVADSYLSMSKIPLGYTKEVIMSMKTRESILQQVRLDINMDDVNLASTVKDQLLDRNIDKVQEAILCWVYFDLAEAEYFNYLDKNIKVELRIVAYAILKRLELHNLADVMLSTPYDGGLYQVKSSLAPVSEWLEKEFDSVYNISINKSARDKKYGLSIFGSNDDEVDIKGLLFNPVIKRLSTTRWLGYHLDKNDNVFIVNNAREEVIKLVSSICNDKI